MIDDRRIQSLLEEVMESGRSPEEVCSACPELLPAVREEVRRLREFEGDVAAMFPAHGGAGREGEPGAGAPEIPGYVVRKLLGRGGIGVVYRARDVTLERDVAVKLLQDRYSSASSVGRRFSDEARITAQLQHPGIPPVHELGTLPDGRPFLAMKLIDGSTLDQMLAARSSTSDGRGRFVAAFEQVCQAVAYAHAHRVIHRDLKPSNVMVGAFGEVQVMDWGLAKVLRERGGPERAPDGAQDAAAAAEHELAGDFHPHTHPGDALGTPAFMPPEQAVGALDRIDARSDVYSLGGILCAVLTGKPPYVARTSEAARMLAAQARLEDARARLAACGAEPELVALCLRCLSPEPDDRPRDAGEVAEAVAALRVAAEDRARRAELDGVRLAEQEKRRRMLLAACAAIAGVLLVGLFVSLRQTRRTTRALAAEQLARQDETKARQQAFDALRTMTADVVERKFAEELALTEEDQAFLRAVIAQFDAFAAIRGDDADSRAVRAEGRLRVGSMRYRLGELEEAEQDYDQAASVYAELAAEFPSRSEFRQDLANTRNNRGHLRFAVGRPEEAEEDYDQAVGLYEQLAAELPDLPELRQDLAGSYDNRGTLLSRTGRPEEARRDYDRALALRRQLAADFPDRPELREALAASHNNRGVLLRVAGQLEAAEADYDQALALRRQLVAELPDRPELRQQLATSHNNRGVLLREAGRLEEAGEDCDECLGIYQQLAAEFPSRLEFQQQLATSHNNRGNLLFSKGLFDEAEEDYGDALEIRRQLAAGFPDQPDLQNQLAGACVNLAAVCERRGDWAAAEQLLADARPHHLAALAVNPDDPTYRQVYRGYLRVLTAAHAGLLEPEDAVRTAEACRDLGWDAAANAYDAACFLCLCVPIAAEHPELDAPQREEAARFYADAAMGMLRDAAGKGFDAVAYLQADADLAPLRQRDDYRELVARLEGEGK